MKKLIVIVITLAIVMAYSATASTMTSYLTAGSGLSYTNSSYIAAKYQAKIVRQLGLSIRIK